MDVQVARTFFWPYPTLMDEKANHGRNQHDSTYRVRKDQLQPQFAKQSLTHARIRTKFTDGASLVYIVASVCRPRATTPEDMAQKNTCAISPPRLESMASGKSAREFATTNE